MSSDLAKNTSSITIPSLSQMDIPIRVSRVQGKVVILKPLSSLPQQSLDGAKCCDKNTDKYTLNFHLDNSDLTDQQKAHEVCSILLVPFPSVCLKRLQSKMSTALHVT